MDAGKLDSRLTLRRRSTGRDAAGQPLNTWLTVASVWANIKYLTGTAAIKADRTTGMASVSIRIRWRADVSTGMHAAYGATVYEIKSALPQGKEWLDLVCEVLQP